MSICVTGANRGIGLEFVRQLVESGHHVIAACRNASPELKALANVRVVEGVDTGSDEGVRRLADAIKGEPVSVLINNAGILIPDSLDKMDFDGIQKQLEINVIGPLRTTMALLPNLELSPGSKVAIVSSRIGSFEHLAETGMVGRYGYRSSKAAVNMIGGILARDLKAKGIAVGLLSPGLVRTDLTITHGYDKAPGCLMPEESVRGLVDAVMNKLNMDTTGSFFHLDGTIIGW